MGSYFTDDSCWVCLCYLYYFNFFVEIQLVLEYCNLGSFGSIVRRVLRRGIEEKHIAAIVYQVLLALKNIAKRNIMHRDIKVTPFHFLFFFSFFEDFLLSLFELPIGTVTY